MLKNKANREKIKHRQHLKDRDPMGPMPANPEVHVLHQTISIDSGPGQLPRGRGVHGSAGSHGASLGPPYNQQKNSVYQQGPIASVHATGSGEQRHQRYSQSRSHEPGGDSAYQTSTLIHQSSAQGRGSGDIERSSNLSISGSHQPANGGALELSRSSSDKRGHPKPHRPGNYSYRKCFLRP